MDEAKSQDLFSGQTTCATLLQQLQVIWDEVGESEEDRDKMLLQLEQECLDVYMRKVDQASKSRALLLKSLADSRAELARLLSALGEKTYTGLPDKSSGTIKEQLAAIAPTLKQLCKQKEDRLKEFTDVQLQIQKIHEEIAGNLANGEKLGMPVVDQIDLSLTKLDEFHVQLQDLQREKSERLHKVLDFVSTIHDLCAVLGLDFLVTITEIHPSLNESIGVQSKSISNDTLYKLFKMVEALKEDKRVRLQKLQVLAGQLTDLWNLMDTSSEERNLFRHVTSNISATIDEVIVPGALALDIIEQAEEEVERLDQLKASRMKEIAMKKQAELEDIYAHAHMEVDSAAAEKKIVALIESGNVEPSELFAEMDNEILKAKEEASSRKEILEKVEKWMSACEEESWLDDYNRRDLQNSPFIVQLGHGASMCFANAIINTENAVTTIKFGCFESPTADAMTVTVPVHDMPTQGRIARPQFTEVFARHADKPLQMKRSTKNVDVEVSRKRTSVFDRLGPFNAPALKRNVIGQRVSLELKGAATVILTKPFAPGKYDAEASSSRGKLSRRQRRKLNAALRAQQLFPKQPVVQPVHEPKDENRYNSSRGAHLNLKRAEKARILVNKIPGLVDTLVSKTRAWEEAHGLPFTYDGVSLLAMLDEYTMLRHDREEEKRRVRDQKRFHEQLATEQEALFGSKPSPARTSSMKKVVGPRANGGSSNQSLSRRLSMSGHHGSNNGVRSASRDGKRDNRFSAPANYVAIAKEDTTSFTSGNDLVLASP